MQINLARKKKKKSSLRCHAKHPLHLDRGPSKSRMVSALLGLIHEGAVIESSGTVSTGPASRHGQYTEGYLVVVPGSCPQMSGDGADLADLQN